MSVSAGTLAHRFALFVGATVSSAPKNRMELRECVAPPSSARRPRAHRTHRRRRVPKLTWQDAGIREMSRLDSQVSSFPREWSKIAQPDETPIAITLYASMKPSEGRADVELRTE